ncbi:hypothetical protein KP509_01G005700 [Ceratopteris richardii]|uniref:MYND-type domain-containing protein n=1 Tax=Ceratopteris richardii TaxID=49495 RepID=A0A8T2VA82_CERRI|nr:hypothetical protein KP509_01G005700 [Ceratopteris richardii]
MSISLHQDLGMDSSNSTMKPAYLKTNDEMLITRHEAEYIVENLKTYSISQVGSTEWLAQHESIEKLNLQAHYNAISHCNDFVMEALILHDKLGTLVHELLVIEIWMENVFPIIIKNISSEVMTFSLSLMILDECSIANLLEVILYHQDTCEAMSSDVLLELADYCCRKLLYLNTRARDDIKFIEKSAAELINMCAKEELEEKGSSAMFQSSIYALSILRYLSDYINNLPLSVMARLIDKHDVLMSLIPLIEKPPWKRQRRKGDKTLVEKYEDGKWREVPSDDLFKVSKTDAQAWLTVYNVLMEPSSRSRFRYDDFHKEQILKVPAIRENLIAGHNWEQVAKTQLITASQNNPDSSSKQISEMLRMFQFGESMEAPKCSSCGAEAVHRCSRCKSEWYCGKACQKKMWIHHKKLCDIVKDNL